MFELIDSNEYEETQLSKGEIFLLVEDYQKQLKYYNDQSEWRLFVRKAVWNFFKDNPTGEHHVIHDALVEMYTTGFILQNTNSNPRSVIELAAEFRYCIDNHLQVISDYQDWKTTDAFPPIYKTDWRATLSNEQHIEISQRKLMQPVRFSNHFSDLLEVYPEIPLFEVYKIVYYQWYGNNILKEASIRARNQLPREKHWKLLVKQMVNYDVVDKFKLE